MSAIASVERFVRSRDPETSHLAAGSISEDVLNEVEAWVMVTLREQPLADHELVERAEREHVGVTPQRIRTIRKCLELAGFVQHNGGFHFTASGRKAQVWQVVR